MESETFLHWEIVVNVFLHNGPEISNALQLKKMS